MVYRGQSYGAPVGLWWTSNLDEARSFARARAGHAYVILALDEDNLDWLEQFIVFPGGDDHGDWYKIPLDKLRERWLAVEVVAGHLTVGALEPPGGRVG